MKKLFAIVLALALALSVSAFAETELETIVIGATPSPHAEILEVIVDDMAELGYDLQIQIFNDYNLPCPAVASGELDANYFAHIPFIDSYNASVSEEEQLAAVIPTHFEPMAIYPGTKRARPSPSRTTPATRPARCSCCRPPA